MMQQPKPLRRAMWQLVYERRDISADIADLLISAVYTDNRHGKSDDLQLSLSNLDGRWSQSWWPTAADTLSWLFGWQGGPAQSAGQFQVAEIELTGPPDLIQIKCNSAGISTDARTPRHQGYDGQRLGDIASTIAARHGMVLVGTPPDIRLDRVTQNGESDLAFLTRLAGQFDAGLKVTGDQLVFQDRQALAAADTVLQLTPQSLSKWSFRAKTHGSAAAASVSYTEAGSGQTQRATATAAQARTGPAAGDMLRPNVRVDSPAAAQQVADRQLAAARAGQIEAQLDMAGEPRLAAGSRIEVSGFGRYDGAYLIESARHRIDRSSGFTTSIEAKSC